MTRLLPSLYLSLDNCSDLTQRFYSDSDCSIYLLEERIDHFTDCQTNQDPSAYRSQSSFRGFCSLGVPFPIPMDSIVKRSASHTVPPTPSSFSTPITSDQQQLLHPHLCSYSHDRDCLTKTYYELRALDLCLDCTNDTSHSPSSEYAICGNYSGRSPPFMIIAIGMHASLSCVPQAAMLSWLTCFLPSLLICLQRP